MRIFIAIFSLLIINYPGVANSEGWMPEAKKISEIIIEGSDANGRALIIIEGGVPGEYIPSECNSPYNTIYLTTERGRGMLSLAISARVSGLPVRLALSCLGDRPLITHIRM